MDFLTNEGGRAEGCGVIRTNGEMRQILDERRPVEPIANERGLITAVSSKSSGSSEAHQL